MSTWFTDWLRRSRAERLQRRQLRAMDERSRKDLAISRVDAAQLAGTFPHRRRWDRPEGDES